MFRQIDLFNILLLERRLRHGDLHNKGNLTREFYTRDIVVVRKQLKSSRYDGIAYKLVFKIKGPYRVLEKATPTSYWVQRLTFFRV